MRPALIFAMLVSLPILMVAHRAHFVAYDQELLRQRVRAQLHDPAFENVELKNISMHYMDVTLRGFVETPEQREEARRRVASIHGVRCREEDNQLRIPARLSAKLDESGGTLALSGWLPSAATVHEVTEWLEQSRPGLKVDATEVKISPWVTRPESPQASAVPAIYNEAWAAVRTPAFLQVVRKDGALQVHGSLPSEELRDAVVKALAGEKGATPVKIEGMKVGSFVRTAKFTNTDALPAFLKDFFQESTAESFEANGEGIKLKGMATADEETRWRELLLPLAERVTVAADLQVFPTRQHFPGYVPQSKVAPTALEPLKEALRGAVFHFDPNHYYLLAGEMARLNAAAQAIAAAGREAHIMVGGYTEEGDPKAQQAATWKRCETVVAEFKDRGLPTAQFEIVVYSPAARPNGGDHHRVVELLLK